MSTRNSSDPAARELLNAKSSGTPTSDVQFSPASSTASMSAAQRARLGRRDLNPDDVVRLQRLVGNRAVDQLARDISSRQPPRISPLRLTAIGRPRVQRDDLKIEDVEEEPVSQPAAPVATADSSAPLMLTDVPWSEIEARQARSGVTIEEVEDEPLSQPGAPEPVKEPSSPLLLADAPWAEVEAREAQERKERSQASDPRYQQKLDDMKYKPGERNPLKQSQKDDLREAQFNDSVAKERRQAEVDALERVRAASQQLAPVAEAKQNSLTPEELKELKEEDQFKSAVAAAKAADKGTINFYEQRINLYQTILRWVEQRTSRKRLVTHLQGEIDTSKVPAKSAAAFQTQATRVYREVSSKLLAPKREEVQSLLAAFRKELADLTLAHKKVDDLARETGTTYAKQSIRELMQQVEVTVRGATFDVGADSDGLNEQITAVRDAVSVLSRSEGERMKAAQKAENTLADHTTEGQDERGKDEEAAAIRKAKVAFKKTQDAVKGREAGITNEESAELRNQVKVLTSFADREKEKKAHDLKEKYEAAPYHLDPEVSKIVHEERHFIKMESGHKSAAKLEQDYKQEVTLQYKASKEIWYKKYLGYVNGTAGARVTAHSGSHGGVPGHHTVFNGPYESIVNARNKDAGEADSVDLSADALLNTFYPSAGTSGAHYSLEFADPKPHAYRGGPTIPGAQYTADRNANNATWTQAKAYMEGQQTAEEARVKALIEAALAQHMWPVHRRDPARRKK